MFSIASLYVALNTLINIVFGLPSDSVIVPGEPILFGIFYLLLYLVIERIALAANDALVSYQNRDKT